MSCWLHNHVCLQCLNRKDETEAVFSDTENISAQDTSSSAFSTKPSPGIEEPKTSGDGNEEDVVNDEKLPSPGIEQPKTSGDGNEEDDVNDEKLPSPGIEQPKKSGDGNEEDVVNDEKLPSPGNEQPKKSGGDHEEDDGSTNNVVDGAISAVKRHKTCPAITVDAVDYVVDALGLKDVFPRALTNVYGRLKCESSDVAFVLGNSFRSDEKVLVIMGFTANTDVTVHFFEYDTVSEEVKTLEKSISYLLQLSKSVEGATKIQDLSPVVFNLFKKKVCIVIKYIYIIDMISYYLTKAFVSFSHIG